MIASLQDCIEHETALVRDFIAATEAEAAALADRKAHASLQQAASRKEALASQLAELGARRDELLAEMGLPPGYAGTDQAASLHPQLAPAWHTLRQLADTARQQNARNGALIAVHLRHTGESLQALRQITQAGAAATYDARGRGPRPTGSRRSIIAA
ncbi:flagella synthesis protein FlgN [Bordetella sp. 2513F-2]